MASRLKGTRFAHASLMVDDVAQSATFFTNVLGFEAVFGPVEIGASFSGMVGAACGATQLLQLEQPQDGITVEFISCESIPGAGRALPPLAHIAFIVSDLDAAIRLAKEAGGQPMGVVAEFTEGRSVYVREPGGAVIELEELFA